MIGRKLPLSVRLEERSMANPVTGCMEWLGYKNEDGYGQIRVGRKMVRTHRAVWQAEYGPIPDGMSVLHRCDNPSCINLAHLFLGTQTDNVADMDAKKRRARKTGEQNGRVKLTEDQVRRIRQDLRFQKEIAAEYGVNQTLVSQIKTGRIWSHVA